MKFLVDILKSLWANHRKKIITFVAGLILAGIAMLTGIPLPELKEAVKDAASAPQPNVTIEAVPAATGEVAK